MVLIFLLFVEKWIPSESSPFLDNNKIFMFYFLLTIGDSLVSSNQFFDRKMSAISRCSML